MVLTAANIRVLVIHVHLYIQPIPLLSLGDPKRSGRPCSTGTNDGNAVGDGLCLRGVVGDERHLGGGCTGEEWELERKLERVCREEGGSRDKEHHGRLHLEATKDGYVRESYAGIVLG